MPVDIVDLTDLKKRGLLKSKENSASPNLVSSEPSPQFGFLDSLAGAGSSDSSYFDATTPSSSTSSPDIQDVKVKLEDFEYKLDRFMERLEAIEAKLQESESNF